MKRVHFFLFSQWLFFWKLSPQWPSLMKDWWKCHDKAYSKSSVISTWLIFFGPSKGFLSQRSSLRPWSTERMILFSQPLHIPTNQAFLVFSEALCFYDKPLVPMKLDLPSEAFLMFRIAYKKRKEADMGGKYIASVRVFNFLGHGI